MYVVTGIWLHMCKCMVECRLGNYFGSHFEVDGWDDEVYWSAWERKTEISSEGCNMTRSSDFSESSLLHHPTRSHRHQGIEICLIWFPSRRLDNSPTLAGNDYSKGSGKGTKDAKAWEKIRKQISSCFWRSCDCFDDASILNGHDIVGEKGRQRAKKSRHIYIYNIYIYTYWATTVPCWPFFHYSNWKSSLGWQVVPWKRHSTKSHANKPISIQPRCLQGLVRGLLASNALPVTKWDPSAAVGWESHFVCTFSFP